MKRFLILVLFFGILTCAFAEEKKAGMANMKEFLNLNSEQEQKVKDTKQMCRTEDSLCFAKLSELRKSLYFEAGKDNPDSEKLNEISEEIGKQHSLLSLCLAKQIKEMKIILTEEQFEKFVSFRQNKGKKFNHNQQK